MVNNFNLIRPLLSFRSPDDFYFLQILQRKKDAEPGMKVNGTNNNSRLIKAYYVSSMEQFDFIEPEVIQLCQVFSARAGINLNRRSFKRMALQHLKKCTDQILNQDYHKAYKAYSSVVGAYNDETDKKWIVDIDARGWAEEDVRELVSKLTPLQPIGEKYITILPSRNGWHAVVKPFNLAEAKDILSPKGYSGYDDASLSLEIHKNNPTNLYIP